jgi:uncharacterized protein DUF2500
MEILFVLVPLIIGAAFLFVLLQIGKQVLEWADNNSKPILAVPARVVTKRTETSGSIATNAGGSVSTCFYVTFELDDGERSEFSVDGRDYGMLVEGDEGTLTHQGTRYHGFERSR